jgi:predicted Zn-dependent protease with MMP-like domain
MLANLPQGRRIAVSAAFCLCVAVLIVTAFRGMSDEFLVRAVQTIAIAVAAIGVIGLVIATVTGRLADYTDPADDDEFEELVREALDDLPDLLLQALEHVAVVISDKGRRNRAYGLYQGDTVARDDFADRIIIFRDTLLRDFGDDPDELRAQVTRTVRHELAHHLGADELGVRELGL